MNLLNKKINDQMRDAGIPRKLRGQKFPSFLQKEMSHLLKDEEKKILNFLINDDGKIRVGSDDIFLYGYGHDDQYIQFDRDVNIPEVDYQTILKNIQKRGFNALISIGKIFDWIEERDWNEKDFSFSRSGRGIEYNLDGIELSEDEFGAFTVLNKDGFDLSKHIKVKFTGYIDSSVFLEETEAFFGVKAPKKNRWK